MSQIVTTEAIVLRAIKFSETSKIVTFYTKELGKIAGIVKGARRKESKIGSALEPMSYIQVVLYVKEGREVQLVSQIALLRAQRNISSDLEKISIGLSLVEIVNAIVREQEQNVSLFILLKEALQVLDTFQVTPVPVLCHFNIKLAELLGFAPVFSSCSNCHKVLDLTRNQQEYRYNLSSGSPVCEDCARFEHTLLTIQDESLRRLALLSGTGSPLQLSSMNLKNEEFVEIEGILTKYLQMHVQGFKEPRSRKLVRAMTE